MSKVFEKVQENIGYIFKDVELLDRALTHASFGDGNKKVKNYERLEFVGDRVLGLLASEALYRKFPKANEGQLAQYFNAIVDKKACEAVARQFELGPALKMSPSEEKIGGRNKASILADVAESLLAAVYLDGGFDAVRGVFDLGWSDALAALGQKPRNPKSELQEWAAKKNLGVPVYTVIDQAGPDHKPVFVIRVDLGHLPASEGTGGSKSAAERAAAIAMLERAKVDV